MDNQATIDMHQIGIAAGDLSHRMLPTPEEGDYVPKAKGFMERHDKKLRVADRVLQKLANWTSTFSLVGPGQVALERVAFRLASQRWLDMALEHHAAKAAVGTLPPGVTVDIKIPVSEARLRASTLTPEMAQRIIDQINLPGAVAYDQTGAGNIWAGWNFDKWTDIEAATAFRQSLYKTNRRMVYRPTASELAMWMSGDGAKIFTQLRTFMLGSYESKTLFNLKMHDRTAIMSMGAQLISKAAAYYAITYLYSLGRADREKFLRDRLDPSKVAKAAFSNSEFASIIPMSVDAVQAFRGRAPVFAFARTTGLGNQPGLVGLVTSNPTADTIDKLARGIGVPLDKVLGGVERAFGINRTWRPGLTDRDIKNIQGGLPWQRMYGIDQFFRYVTDQAPRERRAAQ